MDTCLLTPKLYIPLPRPDLVLRSHLIERLETVLFAQERNDHWIAFGVADACWERLNDSPRRAACT